MSENKKNKPLLSLVVTGHVDAGKSSTSSHLIYKLGGVTKREMEKLQKEADEAGMGSFGFAYLMDKQAEERARGVTITCSTKRFFTPSYEYTLIDAPGHRDFLKNMISGSSQADCALLLVPAQGFETAIARGDKKKNEIQGQSRQHARLLYLLGVKQIIVGVNKMDSVKWSQSRFEEIRDEMLRILKKLGYDTKAVPVIPFSGLKGDNLIEPSDKMPWYKGFEVKVNKKKVKGHTLLDGLEKVFHVPKRPIKAPFRMPVSGVYQIKGVGDVITGRIESGELKPGQDVAFIPGNAKGKVFSIEKHHQNIDCAGPGSNVGVCVKGLKDNRPKVGDCMYVVKDPHGGQPQPTKEFRALVYVQDHPGKLKAMDKDGKGGFSPVVHVRTGRAPCKMTKIHWRMGKSTGKVKVEDPLYLQAGDQAEVTFAPIKPLHVESFKDNEGYGRVAVMDSNSLVMLGRCIGINR